MVDDDHAVAELHGAYVERIPGFTLSGTAHTGQDALRQIAADPPDLVLLDIHLPDLSGLDVLRRLRAAEVPVDVLVVTAARDVQTVRGAVHGGAVHYLVKPFGFAVLRERLERYAGARELLAENAPADQDQVNQVFTLLRSGTTGNALPKGLTATTLTLVASVLRGAPGDLSATEAAELAGLSRGSARRYLEHLISTGQVTLSLRYGSAGRPEHRYHWVRN